MTAKSSPVRMLCIYRVKPGREQEFRSLLDRHWSTLRSVDLASDVPARCFRGRTKDGRTRFLELFEWKNEGASDVAHESPAVMAVWEPMGELADDMEFIELETPIG